MLILNKNGYLQPIEMSNLDLAGVLTTEADGRTVTQYCSELGGISKSESRRKINAGSVWLGDEKCDNPDEIIEKGNVAITLFIGKEMVGIITS